MRLLNTVTLKLVHFMESGNASTIGPEVNDQSMLAVPKYAILSHTWGDGEITFQDMQGDMTAAQAKEGYPKLTASCELASRNGFEYIWIDTCCIDKTSSTELFEAINAMFNWYKNASICYVYLVDNDGSSPIWQWKNKYSQGPLCRWYTRGWTLQELIAPKNVAFFSREWNSLGTKAEHLLDISKITGIDPCTLTGEDLEEHLAGISVARRMSWVARRKTTRPEDMAYCMLGIFSIGLPLLYGEGEMAFVRLQEEILKSTDDQSLFAWAEDDSVDYYREDYDDSFQRWGLLATSPEYFEVSRSAATFQSTRSKRLPSICTNRGIMSTFLMCRDTSYQSGHVYLAVLDCQIGRIPGVLPGIRLKRVSGSNQFVRVDSTQLFNFARLNADGSVCLEGFDPTEEQNEIFDLRLRTVHKGWKPQTIFVRQIHRCTLPPGFWLVPPDVYEPAGGVPFVEKVHPKHQWDPETWVLQPTGINYRTGISAAFSLRYGPNRFILAAGAFLYQSTWKPWCKVIPVTSIQRLEDCENNLETYQDCSAQYGLTVNIQKKLVIGHEMFVIELKVRYQQIMPI